MSDSYIKPEDRPQIKKKDTSNKWKWISFGVVGSIFAVSHLGMIGYIATRETEPTLPKLDIPVGPYTTYKAQVTDEGYAITYRANDPKTAFQSKDIKEKAVEETLKLGAERGVAPDMEGTGRRNAHLLAIAPNANSSMIVVTSPSIEPNKANAYTHRTRAGSHLIKNGFLEEELNRLNMNTSEVWTSIVTNNGSVQHLTFLSDELKKVYKTATELRQEFVVELAGDRQKFLCQGQSLNLFFPAGASKKYIHQTHFKAWKDECKG